MNKTRRRIKKNRDYKRYHKKDKYGRNRNGGMVVKKIFHIFLSLLLIFFMPKIPNHIQIWKDEDEEINIEQPVLDDDEEEEEIGDDTLEEEEEDVIYNSDSPHFALDGRWNVDYTRTYYDVDVEGGVVASYGLFWNDDDMRVDNNYIQYNDEQYGWVNVYALNVDQMKEYGTVVTSTALGSIIEIRLPDSSIHYGIVLDVCGACAKAKKIDVWVKNQYEAVKNNTHIDGGVEFRFKRFGFDGEPIIYKKE